MRQPANWQCFSGCRAAGVLLVYLMLAAAPASSQTGRPDMLRCEALASPLGVDAKQPVFSWRLRDTRFGAKQSAYRLEVASSEKLLASGKADIWDSGKIQSDHSIGVAFAGKPLKASTRYYWRVRVWDHDEKPYPVSETAWWETGLLEQQNWNAKWIGYDEPELAAVRKASAEWITNAETDGAATTGDTHHDFRFRFDASKEVRRASLYVTGRDSAAAWVNGQQVLASQPLPPWKQMPWKTYSVKDITKNVARGANLLGVEVVRYREQRPRGRPDDFQTPMSATIYLAFADGSTQIFKSGAPEKTHFHQINRKTGNRLRQQMVDEETGRVVDKDNKGRGYEISKAHRGRGASSRVDDLRWRLSLSLRQASRHYAAADSAD